MSSDFDGLSKAAAETLALARVKREEAEAEAALLKARSEALKNAAERKKLTLEYERNLLLFEKEKQVRDEEKAKDKYHHVLPIVQVISQGSVVVAIDQLTQWHRCDPSCDIEIIFNSPGGDVISGMHLFDFILWLRSQGHHVTTVAMGMAASMAGILLQAGDTRVIGKQAWLMIHEASFGSQGKTSEVEDRVEWVKRVQERILDVFASRCQATNAPKKLTRMQIKRRWSRKDWWIDSDECLAFGLVDEVR